MAVLSIVVYHVSYATGANLGDRIGPLLSRLHVGVAIFFVVSGFLLYRPFLAARRGLGPAVGTGGYIRRRLLRIVPAYWTALTLLAIWPGLPGVFTGDWWIYYGFLQVYSTETYLQGIGPAWSLATEMAFYLVLPVFAVLVARVTQARRSVPGSGASLCCWRCSTSARSRSVPGRCGEERRSICPPGSWPARSTGSPSAWASPSRALRSTSRGASPNAPSARPAVAARMGRRRRPVRPARLGDRAAERLRVQPDLPAHPVPVLRRARADGAGRPAGDRPRGARGPLRRDRANTAQIAARGLPRPGVYGIFPWHGPIVQELAKTDAVDVTVVLLLATMAVVVPIATASYYVVERPFLRLKYRRRTPAG